MKIKIFIFLSFLVCYSAFAMESKNNSEKIVNKNKNQASTRVNLSTIAEAEVPSVIARIHAGELVAEKKSADENSAIPSREFVVSYHRADSTMINRFKRQVDELNIVFVSDDKDWAILQFNSDSLSPEYFSKFVINQSFPSFDYEENITLGVPSVDWSRY